MITDKNFRGKNMTITEKLEKMNKDIKEKFGVCTKIFKAGGRWTVTTEKGYYPEGKKMKEIRDYVSNHSNELEDD